MNKMSMRANLRVSKTNSWTSMHRISVVFEYSGRIDVLCTINALKKLFIKI